MKDTSFSTLITLLCALLLIGTTFGFRINTEKRHFPFINTVYVHCGNIVNGEFEDLTNPVLFYRSIIINGGEIMTELINGSGVAVIVVDVNPFNEGVFTCVDNTTNEISTNNISIVAFPYVNSSLFTYPQNLAVPIGHSSSPIYCGFSLGILSQYYEIEWWRGTTLLDTNSQNNKYRLLDNLTLIVEDTQISDASDGYYCSLRVINSFEGVVYDNKSPDISLQVYNPLTLTSTLTDTAIMIEQSTSFTCTAQGVPQPNIRWKINNLINNPRYNIQEQVSSTSLLYSVTSTLTLSNAGLTDTGLLECIAYNTNQAGLVIDTNTATLVVFDTPSAPIIVAAQNGGAFLSFTLPSQIPVFFLVHMRYISTDDTSNVYETILSSPLFTNTSMITNYVIPTDSLPTFKSFRTQIAIQVYGMKGLYSTQSSIRVLSEPENTPTTTPSPTISLTTGNTCTDTCNDNNSTSLFIIIGLLTIALIVILLGISITSLYFCYYKRKYQHQTQSPNGTYITHDNEDLKLAPLDSVGNYPIPYGDDHIRSTELNGDDQQTCICTSSQESGIDERKSVSGSPPVVHKVKTSDNSPISDHRNNHYTFEPVIEALSYEPQGIKPTVLPVLIEDSTPREQRKEAEHKKKDDNEPQEVNENEGLLKPLYNESMTSSQGNLTALPPPPPPSSMEHIPYDHNSRSISIQTSIIPSFSQITNPTPSPPPQVPTLPPNLDNVNVTKSLNKILKGYEIV